jgi:hypothetical protein
MYQRIAAIYDEYKLKNPTFVFPMVYKTIVNDINKALEALKAQTEKSTPKETPDALEKRDGRKKDASEKKASRKEKVCFST